MRFEKFEVVDAHVPGAGSSRYIPARPLAISPGKAPRWLSIPEHPRPSGNDQNTVSS